MFTSIMLKFGFDGVESGQSARSAGFAWREQGGCQPSNEKTSSLLAIPAFATT